MTAEQLENVTPPAAPPAAASASLAPGLVHDLFISEVNEVREGIQRVLPNVENAVALTMVGADSVALYNEAVTKARDELNHVLADLTLSTLKPVGPVPSPGDPGDFAEGAD